ncbi:MAG TPA: ABC transporter substrate-binding protein [Chloroflexota bacterium]|nr:ABC transporter substrate-binding protein [Chloroflexota bacterium]
MALGKLWCAALGAALVIACASPAQQAPSSSAAPSGNAAPKRVVAALMVDPPTVVLQAASGTPPGLDVLDMLVDSGLTVFDDKAVRIPQLAEDVPTIENGQWQLLADGRMDTTWRIKSGAVWHDTTPLTSSDLAFALEVDQDKDLPHTVNANLRFLDGYDVSDDRTITVHWNQPFIDADSLFTPSFVPPLPRTEFVPAKEQWPDRLQREHARNVYV